jgi:transposase
VPSGVPDEATQKKFVKRIIRTIGKAEKENGAVVFLDPTHQVYNAVNGYCWQEKGESGTKTVLANSGRKRITILGAINAVSLKPTTLITEDNCDKEMIKQLLREIRKDYQNKGKIYIFLDNARYSWNKEVRAEAKSLKMKLIFLPAYSPNLNLIERLWKFLKKKIRKNIYYNTFKKFKKAIFDFFKNIEQYKTELKKILTLKFEIINPI